MSDEAPTAEVEVDADVTCVDDGEAFDTLPEVDADVTTDEEEEEIFTQGNAPAPAPEPVVNDVESYAQSIAAKVREQQTAVFDDYEESEEEEEEESVAVTPVRATATAAVIPWYVASATDLTASSVEDEDDEPVLDEMWMFKASNEQVRQIVAAVSAAHPPHAVDRCVGAVALYALLDVVLHEDTPFEAVEHFARQVREAPAQPAEAHGFLDERAARVVRALDAYVQHTTSASAAHAACVVSPVPQLHVYMHTSKTPSPLVALERLAAVFTALGAANQYTAAALRALPPAHASAKAAAAAMPMSQSAPSKPVTFMRMDFDDAAL